MYFQLVTYGYLIVMHFGCQVGILLTFTTRCSRNVEFNAVSFVNGGIGNTCQNID